MNSETGISKSQVLAIAVFNLAEQLQLKEFELALILGLSEAELSLVINEKALEPDTTAGEKAIALVNIYQKLSLYTTNFTEPLSYQGSAFLKLPKFP